MKLFQTLTVYAFLLCCPLYLIGQGTVEGTVTGDDERLYGVSIAIKGTGKGTITNLDGKYSMEMAAGDYTLEASYVGYVTQTREITITDGQTVTADFILSEGVNIEEIVVIGSRASNRTNIDSPVPVDVINVNELSTAAPQTQLNQLLHYTAPSFSSNTQTISDGTDHIDPASLRGLGPDQVLVLMNGKRRHTSSLVNVNGTFGRGNVGTDLNAIPITAIETVEVLRDGAAAQYGSDAIAGVINLRLRRSVNELQFTVNTGANFTANSSPEKDIDGETVEVGVNYGLPIGNTGGVINFSGAFDFRGWTNRMQSFEGSIFNGYNAVEWAAFNDGADLSNLRFDDVKKYAQSVGHFSGDFKNLINGAPDMDSLVSLLDIDVTDAELDARGQTRSDYNMRVGQSALRGGKFFANMVMPLGEDLEFYSFGGLSYRRGNSGCFYRLPSQNRTYTPTYINGFVPKINSDITDQSIAAGIRGAIGNWGVDFSNAWGSNEFIFFMTETHNATMGNASPLEFNAGGHSFTQNTSNFDVSQYFDDPGGLAGINVAFGAEYRYENFQVIPGSVFSYGNYDQNLNLVNSATPDSLLVTDFYSRNRPSGCQCFAGFLPSNEVDARRSSVAGYLDTEFDITDDFLIGGAIRFENYSDFGSTFNYKIAARYKIGSNLALRAAHSTGFRAPSLHQIHFSRTSTIFVTENGVTAAQEVGVFSNKSYAAQLLGIPQLKQETSQNFSAGFTLKMPEAGLRLTVDAYQVNIDDRIVLTGQFSPGDDEELISIFNQAQATAAAFFANAIDTKSQGLDIVLTQTSNLATNVRLTNDLAATFSQTRQEGDIKASDLLREKDLLDTYFDETSRIYLEEAVPRTKVTLSNTLSIGALSIYLRNTYFGETTEATNISTLDPGVDFTYDGKVVTDLSLGYDFTQDLNLTIGANNLLDVYPDPADDAFRSSGRFIYSRRSPQFSLNGRFLFARLVFTLK